MTEIQEVYEEIQKKYTLPTYEEIDSEFEIHDIDTHYVLRNVLRKIAEKLEFYSAVLAEVLQPDTGSLSSMHETQFFSDADKSKMYSLYKKIMKAHRSIIEQVLGKEESEQASYVQSFFNEWKEMKKELLQVISKMKDCWDKETTIDHEVGYFG